MSQQGAAVGWDGVGGRVSGDHSFENGIHRNGPRLEIKVLDSLMRITEEADTHIHSS